MKRYVFGMSEDQKTIASEIKSASWSIDEHIIKLLLLPDCQEANHWKREIARFLSRVDKLKGKNKYPPESFIYKCLSIHNDTLDDLTYQVWYNLKESNKRYLQIKTIESAVTSYQSWLASSLSKYGAVEYDSIYAKLDDIVRSSYRSY